MHHLRVRAILLTYGYGMFRVYWEGGDPMSSRLLKLATGLIGVMIAGGTLACPAAMKDAKNGQAGPSTQASVPSSTAKN